MKTHTFETEFAIGDKVFAVVRGTRDASKPCGSCNGQGGADIPGTKIRVECKECDGQGLLPGWEEFFHVLPLTIRSIAFEVLQTKSEFKYGAYGYRSTHYCFTFAYESMEQAEAKAKELNKTT